jgi:hypothetical protein
MGVIKTIKSVYEGENEYDRWEEYEDSVYCMRS